MALLARKSIGRIGIIRSIRKHVIARERRDRGKLIGVKCLPVFIISILLILPHQALAWGSVTHAAICREAGGSEDFVLGGIAPDMIALHSVTTGDSSFDYTHNYFGEAREPVFGKIMAQVSGQDFSHGWVAHQLADSVVHGPDGYSNTKTVFENIPEKYKPTLSHGAVELIVDAIVLDELYHRSVDLWVPDNAELIHRSTVRFYNSYLSTDLKVPRAHIINCHTAADLAYRWDLCLNTNKYLAELMLEEPWFATVRRRFEDFRPLFARSVALVGSRASVTRPPRKAPASGWDRWAELLPTAVARAAEGEEGGEVGGTGEPAGYYRFLAQLGERAKRNGHGHMTKESVRQAAVELANSKETSEEEKVWSAAMAGLTDKRTTDLRQVSRLIREAGRRSSGNGAAGGLKDDVLPYLPCGAALGVVLAALVWMFKKR